MRELSIKSALFFLFLCGAVWQDIRHRGVWQWYYILFGFLSAVCCILTGSRLAPACLSVGIGALLLFFGKMTGEEIGEGDGLFFVVSGLLLGPAENLVLLLSGFFFCGIYSLTLTAAAFVSRVSVRRLRLPFLPFLLPVGLGMMFF